MTLVIRDKKKFRSFILIIATILLAGVVIATSPAGSCENEVKYRYICVKSGDNIWKIARNINNGQDIRETVKKIMKLNGLSSPQLYEFQTLIVPVTK